MDILIDEQIYIDGIIDGQMYQCINRLIGRYYDGYNNGWIDRLMEDNCTQ